MEKDIDAVFYRYKYYILPEEYADLSAVENGAVIKAKRLKEELCMAPNFIYESIQDETLTVDDVNLMFPVMVNLYTHEEYDKILAEKVHKTCPGCKRYFDENDPSLDGHHREISLDGVCYERMENGAALPYSLRNYYFFENLVDRLDELAKCIDKGDQKKFNKICKQCAGWIAGPEKFVGGVCKGKYCIYMKSGLSSSIYREMFSYTAKVGKYEHGKFSKTGWLISPFIEAGALKYRGKIKDNTLVATVTESEDDSEKLDLHVYCKGNHKKRQAALDTLYDYLADKLGETAFIKCVYSIDFTAEKDGLITAAELAEKIAEKCKGCDLSLFPPLENVGWDKAENALPHRRINDGWTGCGDLTVISVKPEYADRINFGGVMAYAYVFAPATDDDCERIMTVLGEYLTSEDKVPEPLIGKEDFTYSFSFCGTFACGDEDGKITGVAYDCFVANEKAFFRFIKILTPVLKGLNARIVVVNGDGVREYKPGFVIEPVDGGRVN